MARTYLLEQVQFIGPLRIFEDKTIGYEQDFIHVRAKSTMFAFQ